MSLTDYTDSLAGLISIALFGSLIGKALRYSVNFVIARGLGSEALGIFTFGLVVVKAGGMFANLGLQTAAQKYISIYTEKNDSSAVFGITLTAVALPMAVGTVCSLVLYFSWPVLQSAFEIEAGTTLRLFFFAIPLYALLIVSASSTRGFKETKYYVYVRDLGQSGTAAVAIAVASFVTVSLYDVIYAYYLSLVIGCALGVLFLYRLGALSRQRRPTFNSRELLSVSLPLLLVSMSQFLISWTDILTLGFFTSSSSVGYYQSAYIYATITFIIFQGINAILPAMVAERYEAGQLTELQMLYSVMTKWGIYVTVLGTLFVIVFAEQLLVLFGPEFVIATKALTILAVGRALAAIPGPVTVLLTMTEYSKLESINTLIFGLCNLVLNLLLVPRYGIAGAAVATALSMVGLNIIGLGQVWYLLRIQPFRWSYLRGGLAVAIVGLFLLILQPLVDSIISLAGVGVIAGLLFCVLIYMIGVDESDELLLENIS